MGVWTQDTSRTAGGVVGRMGSKAQRDWGASPRSQAPRHHSIARTTVPCGGLWFRGLAVVDMGRCVVRLKVRAAREKQIGMA
jgi:hypothetical protein